MTNPTLERAARALCELDDQDWNDPTLDEVGVIVGSIRDEYYAQARAVLMAVLPTLKRYDSDYAGHYKDERGDYVRYDDLQAILNDGEGE